MKNKYRLIIFLTILSLFTLTTYYRYYDNRGKVPAKQKGSNSGPLIDTHGKEIKSAFWMNKDEIVFQVETEVYRYHFLGNNHKSIARLKQTQVIGQHDNNLILCEYKNLERNSPDQIATVITISDLKGKQLKHVELKRTVKLLSCDINKLLVTDNYHGSPGYFHWIESDKGKMTQTDITQSPGRLKEFKLSKTTYYLDKELEVSQLIESPDGLKAIVIETNGQLSVLMDNRFGTDIRYR